MLAVRILTGITAKKWNLRANLMTPIVERDGSLSALRWFARNLPAYEKILEEWGPLRTHSITVALSMANGCAYCAYGHGLALNLYYFKEHEPACFSLSAREIARLSTDNAEVDDQTLADLNGANAMKGALETSDLGELVPVIDEVFRIKQTRTASSDEESKLLHLVSMFEYLNVCGREACPMLDGAHSPINKDTELKQRYEALRPGELAQTAESDS